MNDLIEQLNGVVPAKTLTYVIAIWVATQAAGRVYKAIANGGGLKGIWQALLYGTNIPKE